ncbi:MAG: cysteine synthase A [Oscillospiraceae bacterium]|nr:cysteine synthase A [Oscillospiraceae bacterium]
MRIYKDVTELIGSTPLLELSNYEKENSLEARLLAKLERQNPAGSIKDRAALYMINDAEGKGLLREGATIIEPTSGNTGIGLAAVCAARGYKLILTMPETMSLERRKLLSAYGAQLVLTKGSEGMQGAVNKANELKEQHEGSVILGQFDNKANALSHYMTTGPEIYEDTEGNVDVLVACVGTGGTITGIARYLKEKKPSVRIVAVEPESSPLLSQGRAGAHKIQGIGANFVPAVLDMSLVDEVVTVSDEDALSTGAQIVKTDGILVGISSGAAISAAGKIAKRNEYKGKNIVVVLPDTGERYLSSEMF